MSEIYQCCFCGRTIDAVAPDVGGLLYTMAIDGPTRDHSEQQMYCHTLCLLDRLHTSVKLYTLDIDDADD